MLGTRFKSPPTAIKGRATRIKLEAWRRNWLDTKECGACDPTYCEYNGDTGIERFVK